MTRLWQLVVLSLVIAGLAVLIDPVMAGGWGAQAIIQFAKASLANFFFYWIMRLVLHKRSHELGEYEERDRENTLILGHAIVTGAVLLAG